MIKKRIPLSDVQIQAALAAFKKRTAVLKKLGSRPEGYGAYCWGLKIDHFKCEKVRTKRRCKCPCHTV